MRIALLSLYSILLFGCSRGQPVEPIAAHPGEQPDADSIEVAADDWPWWRGPSLDGKAGEEEGRHFTPPTTWSPSENVAWRREVPGRGHASPAIWQDRVFLATADEEAKTQSLLAFDRSSGELLWNTVVHHGKLAHCHEKNSHASATPACDGERVFGAFITPDGLWVTAVDFDGDIEWQTKAGHFHSQHGYGSSPVLYESLVIVSGDNAGPGYMTALDRTTGEIVWRINRTDHPSYSTPIVAHVAGRDQLLLSGGHVTAAYDPDNGDELWHCDGPTEVMANTMAFTEDLVFASGGYPDKEILCIRADGEGDVTKTHIVWRSKESVAYVPSPLVHEGRLYVVNDQGVAVCFDAHTGKVIWKQRLGGAITSSPVLANGNIYVANEEGTTFVFKASDKYEAVARNDLQESQFATLAIAGSHIYLRTAKHLLCVGQPMSPQSVAQSKHRR